MRPDGYARDGIDPDPLEQAIMALSFGSDHLAMFWRHMLVLPGLVLVAWVDGSLLYAASAPVFAALVVAFYELAWRVLPKSPIILAEILTGALWGGLIVGLTLV